MSVRQNGAQPQEDRRERRTVSPSRLDRDLATHCPTCESVVDPELLETTVFGDDHGEYAIQVLRCRRCSGPLVTTRSVERWAVGNDYGVDVGPPTRVWPPHRLDDPLSPDAPKAVREAFDEVRRSMAGKAHAAATTFVRTCLEEVCDDLGAKGKTLYQKLTKLKMKGLLADELYDWATALREAGNAAVHSGTSPSSVTQQEAQDAVDLTVAIVDHIYTFRRKFEEFKARRTTANP